jgi:hypothetical protein
MKDIHLHHPFAAKGIRRRFEMAVANGNKKLYKKKAPTLAFTFFSSHQ